MKIPEVKAKIINSYPHIVFLDKSDDKNLLLEFRNEAQHDYVYLIWYGAESACASISAKRINSADNEYFWNYPYDPYGFSSLEEKNIDTMDFILEQLEILSKLKTRIIQKNDLLFQTFICELLNDNIWMTYYKHSALKTNLAFPAIDSDQKIYQ